VQLSAKECNLLLSVWASIDKVKLGQEVFIQMFMLKPSIKRLWGLEAVPVKLLYTNERFLKHAASFSMFLDIAVKAVRSQRPNYLAQLARSALASKTSRLKVNDRSFSGILEANTRILKQ